jgi:hypothetical protein
LLFVMLDLVDGEHDRMISDHVVRMHRYRWVRLLLVFRIKNMSYSIPYFRFNFRKCPPIFPASINN